MRTLALLVALLSLSGCWYGEHLYSDADARAALRPGLYRIDGTDKPSMTLRISQTPSGLTHFASAEEPSDAGIAPLAGDGRRFVSWTDAGNGEQLIALIQAEAGGAYRVFLPVCDGAEAAVARAAGAERSEGIVAACRFRSRAELEKALQRLPTEPGTSLMTLTPMPDGQG